MATAPAPGTSERVRADFDRIAGLAEPGWDANAHYHRRLLERLPERCGEALDVGCGSGAFARLLAARAERVLALDLSPEMIRVARSRSAGLTHVDYRVTDVATWTWPRERFDCVASIATLHHLPLAAMLERMARALRPGGVLLVLDLYEPRRGPLRPLRDGLAGAVSVASRLRHTGRPFEPAAVRAAWREHGRHDRYHSLAEVRRACAARLPGVEIRARLLWRYTLVWRRP